MKSTLCGISALVIALLVCYLIGCWAAWSFNPATWDEWGRAAIGIVALVIGAIAFGIEYEMSDMKIELERLSQELKESESTFTQMFSSVAKANRAAKKKANHPLQK